MCIDAISWVETSEGPKTMKDVEEGEYVRAADKMFKRVVFKDIGHSHDSRWSDYIEIEITIPKNHGKLTTVITKDHLIEGKPADQWRCGQKILGYPVSGVKACAVPALCADLLLEDGSDYIANGFVVGSMLHRYGISLADLQDLRRGKQKARK